MTTKDDLDQLFAAARNAAPVPSGDLMARILDDAYAMQPMPAAAAAPVLHTASGPGTFRRLLALLADAVGGTGVLAGLGTAAATGLFLGYTGSSGLTWLPSTLFPQAASDYQMILADDLFLSEG